ncbi:MAG: pilus assembly protein PilM, partial [Parcubacteria group bacterium]|nr:pilus assembly protein PilM [Parcubacteria group bacterium]
QASLRLPPGIVVDGTIKDKNNFTAALRRIHDEVASNSKRKIFVVVSLQGEGIYTQRFGLPNLPEENIEEAVNLNLQMISPIEFDKAYCGWQIIGEGAINGLQTDFLGAFIEKTTIDDLTECLKTAGFSPVAIEPTSLSLVRFIGKSDADVGFGEPQLIIVVSSEGIGFVVSRGGNLTFSSFRSWKAIGGDAKRVTMAILREEVVREIGKITNFYFTQWSGEQLNNLMIISEGLESELSKIVSEKFSFKIRKLAPRRFGDLPSRWFAAAGAVLRGEVPRLEDAALSLTSVGVKEEFRRDRVIHFIGFSRNLVWAFLGFVLVLFLAADIFMIKSASDASDRAAGAFLNIPAAEEISRLQREARTFNNLVSLIAKAAAPRAKWSFLFEKLDQLAGQVVILDRVLVQSPTVPVAVSGRAAGEEAILSFKKKLSGQPQFTDVNLPLTNIAPAGGRFSFRLDFTARDLNP